MKKFLEEYEAFCAEHGRPERVELMNRRTYGHDGWADEFRLSGGLALGVLGGLLELAFQLQGSRGDTVNE